MYRIGILKELGYAEGRNHAIEWGTPATLAAKKATSTIPVVMAATGLSAFVTELEAKRMELLKETVRRVARVVVGDLVDVVSGAVAGRTRPDEITLSKSEGFALEGLAAARLAYTCSSGRARRAAAGRASARETGSGPSGPPSAR